MSRVSCVPPNGVRQVRAAPSPNDPYLGEWEILKRVALSAKF
jgi:hypothetical protein